MRPERPGGENDPSRNGGASQQDGAGGKDLQKLMDRAEYYKSQGYDDNTAMKMAEQDGKSS